MKYLKLYNQFTNEALENKDLEEKLSDKYKDIKIDFLEILSKSIGSEDIEQIKTFLNEYLKDDSKSNIEGLISDSDINQFYIKYGTDIDEILEKDGKLKESPTDIDSFSLYDYVVKQTKTALKELAKMTLSDLESNDNSNESLMFWKNSKNKDIGKLVLVDNKVQGTIFVYQILEDHEDRWKAALIGDIKRDRFSGTTKFTPWLGQTVVVDGKPIIKKFIYDMINKASTYRPDATKFDLLRKIIVGDVKSKIELETKHPIIWVD